MTIFQGALPVGSHLRVPVPMPEGSLTGDVMITATMVVAPAADPSHPSVYTRGGCQIRFRPDATRFKVHADGSRSAEAVTTTFFSPGRMHGGEIDLRGEGIKWEPCMRASRRFRAASLNDPVFDVYYHYRERGAPAQPPAAAEYAMVVSVSAPRTPDLYNRIAARYARVLTPLVPAIDVRVQV